MSSILGYRFDSPLVKYDLVSQKKKSEGVMMVILRYINDKFSIIHLWGKKQRFFFFFYTTPIMIGMALHACNMVAMLPFHADNQEGKTGW